MKAWERIGVSSLAAKPKLPLRPIFLIPSEMPVGAARRWYMALPTTAFLPPVISWKEEVLWSDRWVGAVAFVITENTKKKKKKCFFGPLCVCHHSNCSTPPDHSRPHAASFSWTGITLIIYLYQPFMQVMRTVSCVRAPIVFLVNSHQQMRHGVSLIPSLFQRPYSIKVFTVLSYKILHLCRDFMGFIV